MIELCKVTKSYFTGVELNVLREIDLAIHANEYVGIVGPSGSGKSTLLNLLGLLDRPTTGSVVFEGHNVVDMSDDELSRLRGRSIGFVFQSYHLIGHLSVLENVELPLFYQKVSPRERKRLALERLAEVQMGHRLHHLPAQLSGGEKQRAAIARALISDPNLILADEPTGNLDSKTGEEILAIFKGLQARGKTLVVITHDISIAQKIPRIIRMTDGVASEERKLCR
jgi:putative ABC transport system ATP-binding protein